MRIFSALLCLISSFSLWASDSTVTGKIKPKVTRPADDFIRALVNPLRGDFRDLPEEKALELLTPEDVHLNTRRQTRDEFFLQINYTPAGKSDLETLFVLYRQDKGKPSPLWAWKSDSRDHRYFEFVDANADGRMDLLFWGGDEQSRRASLFLNKLYSAKYSPNNFELLKSHPRGHLSVADINGDGKSEIIESAAGEEKNPCAETPINPTIRDELRGVLQPEPKDATRQMPKNLEWEWSRGSQIFEPIRILEMRGVATVDMTAKYLDHFRWRIRMLEALRPAAKNEACKTLIDQRIGEFQRSLMGTKDPRKEIPSADKK